VLPAEPIAAGETYRFNASLSAPYNKVTRKAVEVAYRVQLGLKGFKVIAFSSAPGLYSAHSGALGPWAFFVTFVAPVGGAVKTAGLDARAIIAIAIVIVVIGVSARTIGGSLERLITTAGETVKGDLLAPIFNPGTLILIVLAIAIVYGVIARKGA
jgi:hypothetical protein